MNFLNKVRYKLFPFEKTRRNVELGMPSYALRHKGSDFIILGTGKTIAEYGGELKSFIIDNSLISIGVNGVGKFIVPDYHAFFNRKRFVQYANSINKEKSIALLSVYFSDQLIRKYTKANYDLVMYEDHGDPSKCYLDDDYVIHHTGASVSRAILVAYAMGANNVFVAGADGIDGNKLKQVHFHQDEYAGLDEKTLNDKYKYWFNDVEPIALSSIYRWTKKNNQKKYVFITPTFYGDYYQQAYLNNYRDSV